MRQARKSLLSAEWTLSLEGKDDETKKQAANELLRVHHAIQKLENAQLTDIKDKLLENVRELEKGRERLANALTKLNQIKSVLNSVSGFLNIIGKVKKLIL